MKLNSAIISIIAILIIFSGCILPTDPSSGGGTTDTGYVVTGDTASVSSSMGLSAVLLDTNIKNINLKSGDYDGSYLVNSAVAISGENGVTINDLKINQSGSTISSLSAKNIEVTENVGDGDCKIQSCFLTNLTINGGGSNSVEISGNSEVTGNMNVNKKNVSVKMNSTITINNALITNACNLIQLDNTSDINNPIIDNVNLNIASDDTASQMNINIVSDNINILSLPTATKMELSGKTSGLNIILNNQTPNEIPNIAIAETASVGNVVSIADTTVDIKITGAVTTISALNTKLIIINPESVGGKVVEQATAASFTTEQLLNFASAGFPKSVLDAKSFPVIYMDDYGQIVIPSGVNSITYPSSFSYMEKNFTVNWTSDNESILSTSSGAVTHSQTASFISYISLTAKISYGTSSVDKVFRVSVMPLVLTTTTTIRPATTTTTTDEPTTTAYVSTTTTTTTTTLPSFIVTFDSQGGSGIASQSIQQDGLVTAPTNPTRDGYTFGGWYKESVCTTSWIFASDIVTADTTIYAKWTMIVGGANVYINLITPTDATIGLGGWNGVLNKTPDPTSDFMTVTATLDGAASWEWYLNGTQKIGEITSSILIDSALLDLGHYTLTVVGYKDLIPYSNQISFDVVSN